ncbi:helix-turn-helix domain-containing protein, partial [Bifidobacterium ruminantium]|uniref:helix-turn-helix domain-containing protein n=1 Tax=Bifidobacterium ruminantium TaxID=78346 RepID=UPI0024934A48
MERLYTPAQVSQMLGVSVKTLEKWRWERRNLPYVKLGAAVRYRESDLERWIDDHTVAEKYKGRTIEFDGNIANV